MQQARRVTTPHYDRGMNAWHQQRFAEVTETYLGEVTAALATRQMLACAAGTESVTAVLFSELSGTEGLTAVTATRVLFAPLGDEGDAVSWQRSALIRAEVLRGGAAWGDVWRIGWPPESAARLHYGHDRVLTLTAPSASSVSRDLGDQFAHVVAGLVQDGAGRR